MREEDIAEHLEARGLVAHYDTNFAIRRDLSMRSTP